MKRDREKLLQDQVAGIQRVRLYALGKGGAGGAPLVWLGGRDGAGGDGAGGAPLAWLEWTWWSGKALLHCSGRHCSGLLKILKTEKSSACSSLPSRLGRRMKK